MQILVEKKSISCLVCCHWYSLLASHYRVKLCKELLLDTSLGWAKQCEL